MSDQTDSFFFLDDDNLYPIYNPIQIDSATKCEEDSFYKTSKPEIFKITNYKFLKKKREETINKIKKRRQWTSEEDHKLSYLISNYKDFSWAQISSFFSERSQVQCMHRWTKVIQPFLKKGKWTEEEDKLLLNWVEQNGPQKWSKLSFILKGRSSKQIRDRWINNLNPDKSKTFQWTDDLDKLLLLKYIEIGSSWVTISKHLEHTTENMIKNRFYSLLRSTACRIKKKFKLKSQKQEKSFKKSETAKNPENFWIFDLNEEIENKKTNSYSSYKSSSIKYKKNNYSLSYLLKYLPYLLEEKGINIDNSYNNNRQERIKDNKYEEIQQNIFHHNYYNNSCDLQNENKTQILTRFFDTLTQKFSSIEADKNNQSERKAQLKFKSTILLNLQLTLLHKIFDRLKLQVIQRFFECFKENTISS